MLLILQLILALLCTNVYAATEIKDEGSSQGYVNILDCVGAGVSCSRSGITGTLNISGGGGGGTPGGSDTQVQFNDAGSFGGDAGLIYNKTTDKLTIAGDLTVSGDDLFMATNTAGMLLIADGTNFNPISISGDATITSGGVIDVTNLGLSSTTGASISAASGLITFAGIGNVNNENLILNLEGTSNRAVFTSGTGVTGFDISGMGLNVISDDRDFSIGGSSDLLIQLDTAETNDTVKMGLNMGAGGSAANGTLMLLEYADVNTNFGVPVATNPTFRIQSADATSTSDFITFAHNQTDAVINVGSGNLNITTAPSVVISGDLTVSGDDITMATNTAGHLLIADGTNFNPTAVSGDVTITSSGVTSIGANTVALTTDTTGDYVASVADGTGIDGTASGEGSTYTPTLDTTEVNDATIGDGTDSNIIWNWDTSAGKLDFQLDGTAFVEAATHSTGIGQLALFGNSVTTSDLIYAPVTLSGTSPPSTYFNASLYYNPSSGSTSRAIVLNFLTRIDANVNTTPVTAYLKAENNFNRAKSIIGAWADPSITTDLTVNTNQTMRGFYVNQSDPGVNVTGGTHTLDMFYADNCQAGWSSGGGTFNCNAFRSNQGNTILNEGSGAYDLRVETDSFARGFYVDGTNNRIGFLLIGASTAANYDLSIGGNTAKTMAMERHTTAASAGNNFTISAGGAISGSTDLAGGDLILTSGIATGNGESKIQFQTVKTSQGTGTTDRSPATLFQIDDGTHIESLGTAPTVSTCGTSPSIVGTDTNGTVTIGSGTVTACTVTFEKAFTNRPQCFLNEGKAGTTTVLAATTTTTVLTINSSASIGGSNIDYFCIGRE